MTSEVQLRPAIVVVEDDPDVLRVLQRLLSVTYPAYEVVTAKNGTEALAHVAARPVALIVTDYTMPEMNGIDLTHAVKERSPQTYVVLITAYATPEVERRALQAGVDRFLAKPFKLDQVEVIVHEALHDR